MRNTRSGMVIMEMVAFAAILLVLAGVSFKLVSSVIGKARVIKAKAQISQLALVLETVKDDTGYYPVSLAQLLSSNAPRGQEKGWHGPYLSDPLPTDPWSGNYLYQIPQSEVFESPKCVRTTGTPVDESFFFACEPGSGILKIDNYGVSSGRVYINGTEVVSPNEFTGGGIDFDITNNEVIPNQQFTGRADVIGAAIVSGSYDCMVTAKVSVGTTSFEPWGSYSAPVTANLNDGQTHTYDLPSTYASGTVINVTAKSWVKKNSWANGSLNSSWVKLYEVSSASGSQLVKVLRNGSAVPDIAGFQNQASIEKFLRSYINTQTGTVTLDANQAIYLFELGTTNLSSAAADFQDLVILVTLSAADGSAASHQTITKIVGNLAASNVLTTRLTSAPGSYCYVNVIATVPCLDSFTLSSYGKDGREGGSGNAADIRWLSDHYPPLQ